MALDRTRPESDQSPRLRIEVENDQRALKTRQHELGKFFLARPAEDWAEAVENARYLLSLFNLTPDTHILAANS